MLLSHKNLLPFLAGAAVGWAAWAGTVGAQPPAVIPAGMEQNVVADVNGVLITRQQLAEELIARKGRAQLEALINRTMIEQACKSKGIKVDEKEVQAELLSQVKATSSASIQDFEHSVLREMKTTLYEFREDIIRPRLMIEKLAKAQLSITDEDLKREFAARYGEKVACRIITFKDQQMARKAWHEIASNPNNFIRLAKQQANPDLAASAGMLTPFGRHTTHDIIEQRAFGMKEGEVSEVLQTPEGGWVILLKEHQIPARADVTFEQKREELLQSARERKGQQEVPAIVQNLKKEYQGKIKNYLNQNSDLNSILSQYQKTLGQDSPK
jgi:hypothetical protein